jgi:hypothetical protein
MTYLRGLLSKLHCNTGRWQEMWVRTIATRHIDYLPLQPQYAFLLSCIVTCTSLVVTSAPAPVLVAEEFLALSEASSAASPELGSPAFMESDPVPLPESTSSPAMKTAPLFKWASDLESSDDKVPDLVIIPEVNYTLLDEEPPFPSKPSFVIDAEPEARTVSELTSPTLLETTPPAAPVATPTPVYVTT